jgi:hypothetical protein
MIDDWGPDDSRWEVVTHGPSAYKYTGPIRTQYDALAMDVVYAVLKDLEDRSGVPSIDQCDEDIQEEIHADLNTLVRELLEEELASD